MCAKKTEILHLSIEERESQRDRFARKKRYEQDQYLELLTPYPLPQQS